MTHEERLREAAFYWRDYCETRTLENIPNHAERELAEAIDAFHRYPDKVLEVKVRPTGPIKYSDEEIVLCDYISNTPALLSLLYDIDLLPEKTRGTRDFRRTMLISAYWRKESVVENEGEGK